MTDTKKQAALFVVTLGFIASMGAVIAKNMQLKEANTSLAKSVQTLNAEALSQMAIDASQDSFNMRIYETVGSVLTEQQKAALCPKLTALINEHNQEVSRLAKILN